MSFGHEKLARLLSQPDIAYDDRLSVCKALADVSSNRENAMRIAASPELTQQMANILNRDRYSDIDSRHQIQVTLAITRCAAAGGDDVSLAFSKVSGLVEGLCKLARDSEPFMRVSASAALRLLVRCNEACGLNRRLLRTKWKNVMEHGQQGSPASQPQWLAANTPQDQPPGGTGPALTHTQRKIPTNINPYTSFCTYHHHIKAVVQKSRVSLSHIPRPSS
jgi:hypothetical protein